MNKEKIDTMLLVLVVKYLKACCCQHTLLPILFTRYECTTPYIFFFFSTSPFVPDDATFFYIFSSLNTILFFILHEESIPKLTSSLVLRKRKDILGLSRQKLVVFCNRMKSTVHQL